MAQDAYVVIKQSYLCLQEQPCVWVGTSPVALNRCRGVELSSGYEYVPASLSMHDSYSVDATACWV